MPCLSPSVVHCYHRTCPDRAIVAANTDTIWMPTGPSERPLPRRDGWWGPHEYAVVPQLLDPSSLYLGWIPFIEAYTDPKFPPNTHLDPTLLRLSFDDYPLHPVTDLPSLLSTRYSTGHDIAGLPPRPQVAQPSKIQLHQLFRTSHELREIVKEKVAELIANVSPVISAVKNDRNCLDVRIPEQALFRLEQAYLWNRLRNSEAGHRLVLAGLKRAVLELHAFILWYHDQSIVTTEKYQLDAFTKSYRTRGVYVNNVPEYDHLRRFGIAVFLEVNLKEVRLPPQARHVELTPIPIERNALFPEGYSGGHHCYLFFYPPIIQDSVLFERAARGYHSRSDIYRANRSLEKIFENIRRDTCE